MDKKGFVLVETIFMTIVVIVALLIVYKSFVSTLQIEKERTYFNNTNYIYRTYIMRDYLLKANLPISDNSFLGENGIVKISCNNEVLGDTRTYCDALMTSNVLDIKDMYITAYNPNLTSAGYNSVPPTMADYLKTINTDETGYRLTILFNDDNIASMSLLVRE